MDQRRGLCLWIGLAFGAAGRFWTAGLQQGVEPGARLRRQPSVDRGAAPFVGPRRFNEIKRLVGGISQRMLTLTLRGLERDGLVTRTVTASTPPRVDYALTEMGRSLWQPVRLLSDWARAHRADIEAARQDFDRRTAPG